MDPMKMSVPASLTKPTAELTTAELVAKEMQHKTPDAPTKDMAFVNGSTLRSLTDPHNLNGGRLHDIYIKREDDFEEPELLEVQYADGRGGTVREIIFIEPVYAEQRPRICVSIEGVQAMHRCISCLSRKVDNLVVTLRDCRTAYYTELVTLREQVHQASAAAGDLQKRNTLAVLQNPPPLYFDPASFDASVNEEVFQRKVRDATVEIREKLMHSKEEVQRLEKRIRIFEKQGAFDGPRSQIERLLDSGVSVEKLFEYMRAAVGRGSTDAFYQKVDNLMQDWRKESGKANPSLERELEDNKKQLATAMAKLSESEAALKHHRAEIGTMKHKLSEDKKEHAKQEEIAQEKLEATYSEVDNLKEQLAAAEDEFKRYQEKMEHDLTNLQAANEELRSQLQGKEKSLKRHTVAQRLANAAAEGKKIENYAPDELAAFLSEKMNRKELAVVAHEITSFMEDSQRASLATHASANLNAEGRTQVAREVVKGGITANMASDFANHVKEAHAEDVIKKVIPKLRENKTAPVAIMKSMALSKAASMDVLQALSKDIDEEDLILFSQKLPDVARKAVVIDAMNAYAAKAGVVDSDSSGDGQEEAKIIFDPANDLSKKARRAVLERLFKRMPANEVKQIANNLGAKAKEAIFQAVFDDQNADNLRRGAHQIRDSDCLQALAEGLPEESVQQMVSMLEDRRTADTAPDITRSDASPIRKQHGVGVQTSIAGVATPLLDKDVPRERHRGRKGTGDFDASIEQSQSSPDLSQEQDLSPRGSKKRQTIFGQARIVGKLRVNTRGSRSGESSPMLQRGSHSEPKSPRNIKRASSMKSFVGRQQEEGSLPESKPGSPTVNQPNSPRIRESPNAANGGSVQRSSTFGSYPLQPESEPDQAGSDESEVPGSVRSQSRVLLPDLPDTKDEEAAVPAMRSSWRKRTHGSLSFRKRDSVHDVGNDFNADAFLASLPSQSREPGIEAETQTCLSVAGLTFEVVKIDQQESQAQRMTLQQRQHHDESVLIDISQLCLNFLHDLHNNPRTSHEADVMKRIVARLQRLGQAIQQTNMLIYEHTQLGVHAGDLVQAEPYMKAIDPNAEMTDVERSAAAAYTQAVAEHGQNSIEAIEAAKELRRVLPAATASLPEVTKETTYAAMEYQQAASMHGEESPEAKAAASLLSEAVAKVETEKAAAAYHEAVAKYGDESAEAQVASQAYAHALAVAKMETEAAQFHQTVAQHGDSSPEAMAASQAYAHAAAIANKENSAVIYRQLVAEHGAESELSLMASTIYAQAEASVETDSSALEYTKTVEMHGEDSEEAEAAERRYEEAAAAEQSRTEEVQEMATDIHINSVRAVIAFKKAVEDRGELNPEVMAASAALFREFLAHMDVFVNPVNPSMKSRMAPEEPLRRLSTVMEYVQGIVPETAAVSLDVIGACAAYEHISQQPDLPEAVAAASEAFKRAVEDHGTMPDEAFKSAALFARSAEQQQVCGAQLSPEVLEAAAEASKSYFLPGQDLKRAASKRLQERRKTSKRSTSKTSSEREGDAQWQSDAVGNIANRSELAQSQEDGVNKEKHKEVRIDEKVDMSGQPVKPSSAEAVEGLEAGEDMQQEYVRRRTAEHEALAAQLAETQRQLEELHCKLSLVQQESTHRRKFISALVEGTQKHEDSEEGSLEMYIEEVRSEIVALQNESDLAEQLASTHGELLETQEKCIQLQKRKTQDAATFGRDDEQQEEQLMAQVESLDKQRDLEKEMVATQQELVSTQAELVELQEHQVRTPEALPQEEFVRRYTVLREKLEVVKKRKKTIDLQMPKRNATRRGAVKPGVDDTRATETSAVEALKLQQALRRGNAKRADDVVQPKPLHTPTAKEHVAASHATITAAEGYTPKISKTATPAHSLRAVGKNVHLGGASVVLARKSLAHPSPPLTPEAPLSRYAEALSSEKMPQQQGANFQKLASQARVLAEGCSEQMESPKNFLARLSQSSGMPQEVVSSTIGEVVNAVAMKTAPPAGVDREQHTKLPKNQSIICSCGAANLPGSAYCNRCGDMLGQTGPTSPTSATAGGRGSKGNILKSGRLRPAPLDQLGPSPKGPAGGRSLMLSGSAALFKAKSERSLPTQGHESSKVSSKNSSHVHRASPSQSPSQSPIPDEAFRIQRVQSVKAKEEQKANSTGVLDHLLGPGAVVHRPDRPPSTTNDTGMNDRSEQKERDGKGSIWNFLKDMVPALNSQKSAVSWKRELHSMARTDTGGVHDSDTDSNFSHASEDDEHGRRGRKRSTRKDTGSSSSSPRVTKTNSRKSLPGARRDTRRSTSPAQTPSERIIKAALKPFNNNMSDSENLDAKIAVKLQSQLEKQFKSDALKDIRYALEDTLDGKDLKHIEASATATALQSFVAISTFFKHIFGASGDTFSGKVQEDAVKVAVENALRIYQGIAMDIDPTLRSALRIDAHNALQPGARTLIGQNYLFMQQSSDQVPGGSKHDDVFKPQQGPAPNAKEWLDFFQNQGLNKDSFNTIIRPPLGQYQSTYDSARNMMAKAKLKPIRTPRMQEVTPFDDVPVNTRLLGSDSDRTRRGRAQSKQAQQNATPRQLPKLNFSQANGLAIQGDAKPQYFSSETMSSGHYSPEMYEKNVQDIHKTAFGGALDSRVPEGRDSGTVSRVSLDIGVTMPQEKKTRELIPRLPWNYESARSQHDGPYDDSPTMPNHDGSSDSLDVKGVHVSDGHLAQSRSSQCGNSGNDVLPDHEEGQTAPGPVPRLNLARFIEEQPSSQLQVHSVRHLSQPANPAIGDIEGSQTERGIIQTLTASRRHSSPPRARSKKTSVGGLVSSVREILEKGAANKSLQTWWLKAESASEGSLTFGALQKKMEESGVSREDAGLFLQAVLEHTSGGQSIAGSSIPGDRAPARDEFLGALMSGKLPQKALDAAHLRILQGTAWMTEGSISPNFRISQVQDGGVSHRDVNTILTSRSNHG